MRLPNYLLVFACFLIYSSCGPAAQRTGEQGTPTENNEEIPPTLEIELLSDDKMKYNKSKITVYEGQEITLTLRHTGKMPKSTMGHNFVLLKPDTNIAKFAMKATEFPDTDYIPEGTEAVIAHTKIIGGGESTSVTFSAPAVGTYDFICSFPGHYGVMQGKFIVQARQ